MQDEMTHYRPHTPESPLTTSLDHATATVDDLTLALANFSRVPSPEPSSLLSCCCAKDDCENLKAWLAFKSNSESRLILSAEVGQALLQRYEAYVRRHEGRHARTTCQQSPQVGSAGDVATTEQVDSRVDELLREKAVLEKRLNQALVNNEVSEVSSKTILHELQEARTTISRLTAHHARSVGLDTRLMAVMQEKEDIQQERNSEAQRARLAESRISALRERTSKLQQEVRHLQDDLEQRRMHRMESSESILQEARARLDILQHSQLGQTAMMEESEAMKVLQSLVEDNETLKRDNMQLQTLLAESREDLHALQEEVEEQRANPPDGTPQSRHLLHAGDIPPSMKQRSIHSKRRPTSLDSKPRRVFAPLTPETNRRPLSPMDSLTPSETKWTAFSQPQPSYPPSEISFDIDEDDQQHENAPLTPEKTKSHKQLVLLSRSRGVQTDGQNVLLPPSPLPSYPSPSPREVRSEASSVTDSQSSHMSILVERVVSLLNRMVQADALTLTNRLKRQHLQGADLGHLSRSTVDTIVSEVSNLRTQFRSLLEDDKITITCTRKDLRGLFKLFRDIFLELGEMRVTLNGVILDPSVASQVSELALNPSSHAGQDSETPKNPAAGRWMAPISKLFGSPVLAEGRSGSPFIQPRSKERGPARPPPRVIPKLGPALSASATTVKVEFSGTGVGKSVTSTFAAQPPREINGVAGSSSPSSYATPFDASKSVMGIFAGAPRSSTPDSWVVLPKSPRKVSSRYHLKPQAPAVFRPPPMQIGGNASRLSRNVDAVIDVQQDEEGSDFLPPLLQRTLRKRGLSDSSIHSTFTSQGDEFRLRSGATTHDGLPPRYTWAEKSSVLQALSRKVQSFRLPTSSGSSGAAESGSASEAGTSPPHSSNIPRPMNTTPPDHRVPSPSFAALLPNLPNLSSWTGVGSIVEPFHMGSARDESFLRWGQETHGRDY